MSSSQFTIDIIANDEASEVISNVQTQLNGVGAAAGTTTGAMTSLGTATAATNTSFLSSMGAITQVTAGFGQAVYSVIAVESAHAALDRTLRMVDLDTFNLQKDTEKYNAAVAQYGPNSKQASDALTTLDLVQQKLADDQERATVQQQNYDMALVQLATFTIPMLLTSLAKLPAAYDAVGNIGAKLGLGETATAAETAGTSLGTTGTAVTGIGAASTGAAAGLGAVAVGAAAVAAEGMGTITVLTNLNDKIKAGTVSTTDLAAALISAATPEQLMTQGLTDFMTKLGLLPAQAGTVGDQTIASFQNLYAQLVGHSIWPDTWTAMQLVTTKSTLAISDLLTTNLEAWATVFTTGGAAIESDWQNTLSAMESSTESALQTIYSEMQSKLNAIVAAVQAAKQQISSGSIWPDMLDEMVAQTHAGMAAIQGEFAGGFDSPGGIIPTVQAGGQSAIAAGPSAAPTTGQGSQAITLPINVYLDGQQIQTFMEKRMVDTLRQNAGRSKRSGRV